MSTKPEVFIIESLDFVDEEKERFEGQILSSILKLGGKRPKYYYFRTRRELVEILKIFGRSRYRYLHLSCHDKACQLVVSVEGFLSRADVRDLVERRREAARIRSGYYDYLPPWARPTWGVR